jgi:multiple sugar transport system permease protein
MAGNFVKRSRARWVGLAYLSPALLFVAVFVLWPLGHVVWLSFTSTSLLGGGEFVGFDNYVHAFTDKKFWAAFRFTLLYTLYLTPVLMVLGLALALLVSQNTPLKKITRTVVFLPVVIGLASSSLLWFWLFDQQVGLFNKLLVDVGILDKPIVWFRNVEQANLAVMISVAWKVVGFGMILILAGIQSIGSDLIEASRVDGAGLWLRIHRIIIPLAARSILLAALVSAIGSMLAFDQFYLMTGGGPRGKTFTSVYWIYQNSFVRFELGYGAALSVLLMLFIFSSAALQLWITRHTGRAS